MSCFGVLPAATPGLPESESHSLAPGPAHSGGDLRREGPAPRSAGEGLRTHRACRCSGRGWARRSPPLRQLCRALARGHTHTSALLVALRVLWSEKSVGRVRGCEAARLGRGGGGITQIWPKVEEGTVTLTVCTSGSLFGQKASRSGRLNLLPGELAHQRPPEWF